MSDTKVAIEKVATELMNSTRNYPPFNSAHEGFSVLKEEVDELWEAVRLKQGNPVRLAKMEVEIVQVAAMALRFMLDITEKGNNR